MAKGLLATTQELPVIRMADLVGTGPDLPGYVPPNVDEWDDEPTQVTTQAALQAAELRARALPWLAVSL